MPTPEVDVSARMRSSIACLRCRRSKIKCENTGHLDAACENCIKSGHKCEWPDPISLSLKRPEPPVTQRQDKDGGPERKKLKKPFEPFAFDGARYAEEVLTAQFIDRDLWDKIFVTYKRHFATELPFLHIPTLKSRVYDLHKEQKRTSPELNLVLLGLLALTARYHSDLVKYVEHISSDKPSGSRNRAIRGTRPEATAASDFFAAALDRALGSVMTAFATASVERVQAFLMLGLCEWISPVNRGLGAWMYVGAAGRMAQALKLSCGDKPFHRKHQTSRPMTEEDIISREVRRRTMYSCFILDRLMSCGRGRLSFIRSEDLHIQLPCAEEDFDLSRQVDTGFLSSHNKESSIHQTPNVLGRFMQLVDLWGDLCRFSYSGGRFKEKVLPPWDQRSRFSQLRKKLDDFSESLDSPQAFLGFSPSNFFKHDNGSSTYVSLHMLLALCKLILHREFVPFVPLRCDKPMGPLDEPSYPSESVPPEFWEDSAEELFKAARVVVDLIELCGDKLPHSSLIVFTIWTAAFVGIYARSFPQMDQQMSMIAEDDTCKGASRRVADSYSIGTTKTTFDTLTRLAQYSGVASSFAARFKEADEHFVGIIADYHRNSGSHEDTSAPETLDTRASGKSGGPEEWARKAERLTSNGLIIEEDRGLHAAGSCDVNSASTVNERSPSRSDDSPATMSSMSTRKKEKSSALKQHAPAAHVGDVIGNYATSSARGAHTFTGQSVSQSPMQAAFSTSNTPVPNNYYNSYPSHDHDLLGQYHSLSMGSGFTDPGLVFGPTSYDHSLVAPPDPWVFPMQDTGGDPVSTQTHNTVAFPPAPHDLSPE